MGLNTGYQQVRPERAGGRRLVAERRRAAPTTSPWSARSGPPTTTTARSSTCHTGRHVRARAFPDDRLVGQLRPGHAQSEPARVRRARRADRRLLRRRMDARRRLPRPGIRRRAAQRRRPRSRCPSSRPAGDATAKSRRPSSACSAGSIAWPASTIPTTRVLRARIKSYELAFGMQTAVPETLQLEQGIRGDAHALRHGSRRDAALRRSCAWRPAGWSSAASGSCRSSTAAAAAAPGTPIRASSTNHGQLSAQVDQPIAGLAQGPQAARHARRNDGRLGHRVRPLARRAGRRPRPPPPGLLRLAGRRRHQGRRRPRRDRRTRLPRRRGPPLRHRHPRDRPAPARPGLPQAGSARAASGWRSTTAQPIREIIA